ncbi:MAG TPA: hypothetical protein VFS39_19115 [Nitrospira sp.]|nr:hypothetical protein [Nitrospira sp.]
MVAWSILGYLCLHPYAKDTALGIGKWWLAAGGLDATSGDVARALNYLAMSGWLISFSNGTRHPIYGLNPERREELHRYLEAEGRAESSEA